MEESNGRSVSHYESHDYWMLVMNSGSMVAAGLSFVGGLSVLVRFLIYRKQLMTHYLARLVLMLSVADMSTALMWLFMLILYFLDPTHVGHIFELGKEACEAMGPLIFYLNTASYFCNVAIATENMRRYTCTDHKANTAPVKRLEYCYFAMCWGLPLLFVYLMAYSAQHRHGWFVRCWFGGGSDGLSYSHLTVLFFTVFYCSLAVVLLLKSDSHYDRTQGDATDDRPLLRRIRVGGGLYLIVFALSWGLYVVYFIMATAEAVPQASSAIRHQHPSGISGYIWYIFAWTTSFVIPLSGFLNAFIWWWDPEMKNAIDQYTPAASFSDNSERHDYTYCDIPSDSSSDES